MVENYRQDERWFASLLLKNSALKFSVIISMVLNIILMFFVFSLWNRGKEVYVFDGNSGRTFGTTGQISRDEIDIQVKYRSKLFISDFLNYDHLTIEKARYNAFLRLSPQLKNELGQDLGKPDAIETAIKKQSKYTLEFLMGPNIIGRAHPNYRVFVKVKRKIVHNDRRYSESELNFALTLVKRQPTDEFPDGLFITEIQQIDKDDKNTLNELINLMQ